MMSNSSTSTMNNGTDLGVYNTVVEFKRMKDIAKTGWLIEFDSEMKQILNKFAETNQLENDAIISPMKVFDLSRELYGQRRTSVAVTGLYNKGKTHCLNNICHSSFKAGLTESTRGISMISKCDDISLSKHIFFDTEGTNVPLVDDMVKVEEAELKRSNERFHEPIQTDYNDDVESYTTALEQYSSRLQEKAISIATINKKASEVFLLDMVFDVADLIIVVVNSMTWSDQQFIQAMSSKLRDYNLVQANARKQQKHPKLIVIHNFKEVTSKSEFDQLIEKYVTSCFVGVMRNQETSFGSGKYIPIFESYHPVVATHIFLGKDPSEKEVSEAGDNNSHCYNFLRNLIANVIIPPTKDSFLINFATKVKANIKKFFKSVGEISFKYRDGNLYLFHEKNLELNCENIRVENFSLVSAASAYQPEIDVIKTLSHLHVIIDCPGLTFKRLKKNTDTLGKDEFTVKFNQQLSQICIYGNRTLCCYPVTTSPCSILTEQVLNTYLEEDGDVENNDQWEIRNRRYGKFENIYEVKFQGFDVSNYVYHQDNKGVLQISCAAFGDEF